MKEPSGKAVDGSAIYIPLLQRCRATIACQAARFPQADLPPLKVQLGVSFLPHGRCSAVLSLWVVRGGVAAAPLQRKLSPFAWCRILLMRDTEREGDRCLLPSCDLQQAPDKHGCRWI